MTIKGDIQRQKTLAQRYLICQCYAIYTVKMKQRENPVNYAERVARAKGRDGDLEFERVIRDMITAIKGSNEYSNLLHGIATPDLILDTLTWHHAIWSCR